MRPPRVAILVFFSFASLFLVCRSISSTRRPSPAATSSPSKKSSFRALFSFGTPFSLFPPSAAISLTDDNSTFFPARPAAFGPPLPAKGLSGQLWIGNGFVEELQDGEGEGELGCSDVPGWEDGRLKLAIKTTEQKSTSSKSGSAAGSPKRPKTNDLAKDSTISGHGPQKRQAKRPPKRVDDGTDDYLHEDLLESRGAEGRTPSGASHADIQSIQETAEITGKVVLLSRGGCGFLEKVKWAQRRGAIAVIVGDNQKGGPLIQMFARGNADNVTIPSVFTTRTTAHLLSSLMQPGSFVEDISGRNRDPKLKVQRSAKTGRNKILKRSQVSAESDTKTPVTKPVVARGSWLSRLFSSDKGRSQSSDRYNLNDQSAKSTAQGSPKTFDGFQLGAQDRRGKPSRTQDSVTVDSLSSSSEALTRQAGKAANSPSADAKGPKIGSIASGSGQYGSEAVTDSAASGQGKPGSSSGPRQGLVPKVLSGTEGAGEQPGRAFLEVKASSATVSTPVPPPLGRNDAREGLWVTITPTGSASPFFDTLLVLVVSPLITLTVVYALLILRVKIRMRRWRAPKSVVDRLPVRTYHTVAPSPTRSPRTPSPNSSSPTTPLLQGSSRSRPRSHTTTGVPEGSPHRSDDAGQTSRPPSHEKHPRSGMSSEWKKYMGRQVECVVCLEEYVDGVSRVMSLPCGHEFHAECITPWLTTRRRTCPICKNDVVRSLARGASSEPQYEPFREDGYDSTGEASETFEQRLPSPNRLDDDLERGPGWSQRSSRQDWRPSRNDVWFSAWTSRFGQNSSLRPDDSGGDRGR